MDSTSDVASTATPHFAISVVVFLSALAGTFLAAWSWNLYHTYHAARSKYADDGSAAACNVLGVQIRGQIVGSRADIPITDTIVMQHPDGGSYLSTPNYTIADEIEDALRSATTDAAIKAVIVDIDSGGGAVVGGQEIASALRKVGKPTAAVIRDLGASAAYLSAAAAQQVFAAKDSAVGSIGVTSSFSTQASKTTKDGLVFEQLSSGPFKDTFNVQKPLTDAERALIMRDVKISRNNFVQLVSEYRSLPFQDVDKIADGSTVLGGAALELGLIDDIGGISEGIEYIHRQIGEPVSVCWR